MWERIQGNFVMTVDSSLADVVPLAGQPAWSCKKASITLMFRHRLYEQLFVVQSLWVSEVLMAFKNKAQNLCTERFLKPSPAVHHVKVYFDDFLFQWREIYVHLTFLALHTLQFAERNTGSYNRPTGLDSATALMLYRGIQKKHHLPRQKNSPKSLSQKWNTLSFIRLHSPHLAETPRVNQD